MEKYAIIKLAGRQFKVKEGLEIKVDSQETLDIAVILYSDGKEIMVGNPVVEGIKVKAKVVGEERASKILVKRYKSKSRYRKTKGHRQPLSIVRIESIGGKEVAQKAETSEKKASVKKPVKKSTEKKTTSKKVSSKNTKGSQSKAKKS